MSIKKAISDGRKGFHIGQRLILPFQCHILKIIFDNHIYTELVGNKDLVIQQDAKNTSVYIRESGNLSNYVNNYEFIKIIACELDDDLTDRSSHQKVVCKVKENHEVEVSIADDDVLFIE